MLERVGLLPAETLVTLARLPDQLIRPANPDDDEQWFRNLTSCLSGDRTFDLVIQEALSDGNLWSGLRARDAAPLGSVSRLVEQELSDTWRKQCEATRLKAAELKDLLSPLTNLPDDSGALSSEWIERLERLPPLSEHLPSGATIEPAEAALRTLRLHVDDGTAILELARSERERNDRELSQVARDAWERLLSLLYQGPPDTRDRVERLLLALPSLVLNRRLQVLANIAGPTSNLEKIAVHSETVYHGSPLRPTHRDEARVQDKATAVSLSPYSKALLARVDGGGVGITNFQELSELRNSLCPTLDRERRGLEWLRSAKATSGGLTSLQQVAFGEGLREYALAALGAGKWPAARNYLRDALALLSQANEIGEDSARKACFELVAAVTWPTRRLERSVAPEAEFRAWLNEPHRMLFEIVQTNQLSIAADEWVNLTDEAAASKFLETLNALLDRPEEWLQACARQLLRPEHATASSDRFATRIIALLDAANPTETLTRELRRLGEELFELSRTPKAEARAEVLRQLEKVNPLLEALDTDTIAPIGLIQVELPRVVEQLGGMTSLGTEPRLTVSAAVRTLFPVDRSEEVEIPIQIRNQEDAAPARDVTITLQAPDGAGDWQPRIETDTQHLGLLGPGVSAYARFIIDLKPDVATHFTEWQLPIISRTGDGQGRAFRRAHTRNRSRRRCRGWPRSSQSSSGLWYS